MTAKLVTAIGLSLIASTAAHATVVVSNAMTKHMSCSAGVCTPTAKNAVLNAGDLAGLLASSDVKITTGSGAVEIHVTAPVTWTSASRLTLDAKRSIAIAAAVVSQGTGGVTIATNDGGSGGELTFVSGGSISFWDNSSSLVIDGNAYTLASDIAALASGIASNPAGFFALAKDYDATGDGTYAISPVPTTLTGTFEGLGHAIANLTINLKNHTENAGLFADTAGTVRDVALTGAAITCRDAGQAGLLAAQNTGNIVAVAVAGQIGCVRAAFIGGVVGSNFAPGNIANASASVTLSSAQFDVGGVAGQNMGTISGASAAGSITDGARVFRNMTAGGIAGDNEAVIEDSHSSVTVNVPDAFAAGGIAGQSNEPVAMIERCSATGNVTGGNMAGGIAGFAFSGVVDSSFATGTVNAALYAGGILGWNHNDTTLANSYATGAVTVTGADKSRVGGLAGKFDNGGSIQTSWSSGAVSGGGRVGGVAGEIVSTTATAAYWDLDTSGISDPSRGAGNTANFPGITGLTTAQFQSGLPSGFDPAIWGESGGINNGYPYLLANRPQ